MNIFQSNSPAPLPPKGEPNLEAIDIKYNYDAAIVELWKKYAQLDALNMPGCEYRKSPLVPAQVKKNCLLFLGMNPSFSAGGYIPENDKEIGYYTLDTGSEKQIPYFKKFQEFAAYCKCDWDHLDLLFIRETNQKVIEDLTYDRPNGLNFISEQLDISFEILEALEPKAIVVANAFASELFGKKKEKHYGFEKIWRGYELKFPKNFDHEIGTYRIPLNGKQVPIFFSGMFSGKRALDLGSLERLMWGVKNLKI